MPATIFELLLRGAGWSLVFAALWRITIEAYEIRLWAIKEFGPVIHEFDPWFNYRATEYLAENGWSSFFTWFDHMSWYPLGRPVATTIYPGMQIASVAMWRVLNGVLESPWSLNDVCCYMPAWFGAVATIFTALLASECSDRGPGAALVGAAAVMAIIPAHAQRSVGGGFDNESVAMSAMAATFFFWCRSLRTPESWPIGFLAGAAYTCMVATWGGYVFVINMIGVHTGALLLVGHYTRSLHHAYTLFFVIGTFGATCVPVVSWTPFKSLEQIGPLILFFLVQFIEIERSLHCRLEQYKKMRYAFVGVLAASVVGVFAVLLASGHFGPFSARVRALFIKHATRTGNPLVDSVSEHSPSSFDAYWTYLRHAYYCAPVGLASILMQSKGPSRAGIFLWLYTGAAVFFSLKMSRLILLLAIPFSALSGVAAGWLFDFTAMSPFWHTFFGSPSGFGQSMTIRLLRLAIGGCIASAVAPHAVLFYQECHSMVRYSLSHPRIMHKAGDGSIIDDYRESYWWLRENTPQDARVMAWWDYGYQIAGLANRTTIADGNTWNIEHIGMLGLCLSSPVAEAHAIAKHLADYILVWMGDDMGKSSHFARISNNAFAPGHCSESDCNQFGVFRRSGKPSNMMGSSLIWHLQGKDSKDGRFRDSDLFKLAYESRNHKVRIVKVLQIAEDSKRWAADPDNRLCDAPGSWYCPGQYPPLLMELFNTRFDATTARNKGAAAYRAEFAARVESQRLELPKPNEPGIPDGSYLGSCFGCRIAVETHQGANQRVLHCSHCHAPGSPAESSQLQLSECPTPRVDNIHGDLQCEPEPNEPDIPLGGYQQSCKGCQMSRDGAKSLLTCTHCGTANGRQMKATFDAHLCPEPGRLDNHDGRLVCGGVPNANGIPPGGYQQSCQGCRLEMEGKLLKCNLCSASDGRQVAASFEPLPCAPAGKLDNVDGVLTCKLGPDFPSGGYQDSCAGCQINGHILTCTHCRTADGLRVEASIEMQGCSNSIDNQDGRLVCLNLPDGLYKDSCSHCAFLGNSILRCKCDTVERNKRQSSYDLRRCQPPAFLDNNNGILTCKAVPDLGVLQDIPEGDFRKSCQGCHFDKGEKLLSCSHCLTADGQQLPSSLNLKQCLNPPSISNKDGHIECE